VVPLSCFVSFWLGVFSLVWVVFPYLFLFELRGGVVLV
jgi:hypothetical protein